MPMIVADALIALSFLVVIAAFVVTYRAYRRT